MRLVRYGCLALMADAIVSIVLDPDDESCIRIYMNDGHVHTVHARDKSPLDLDALIDLVNSA